MSGKPVSHDLLIQTKQPSIDVRAQEESCKPGDSSQESESARDSPAVVGGQRSPATVTSPQLAQIQEGFAFHP